MKTTRRAAVAPIVPPAVLATLATMAAGQGSFTWTGAGGTTTWNDPLNWSPSTGFPTLADDAVFPIAAVVRDGAALNLVVDAGVTLTLGDTFASATQIGSSVTNDGIIAFRADGANQISNVPDHRLAFATGSFAIAGSGVLLMDGIETGLDGEDRALTTVANGFGHTIEGDGTIQELMLDNNGVLRAAGATLTLLRADVDNAGGLVDVEPGAVLTLESGSSIVGGTLNADGGVLGSSSSGVLRDVRLTGSLTVGTSFATEIGLEGTILNDATVAFLPDAANQVSNVLDQRFAIGGVPVTIGGSGSLTLHGVETGIDGTDRETSTVTNGASHTIAGVGGIRRVTLNNSGTIIAGGGLFFELATVQNGGGRISIDETGLLLVQNDSEILGGVIAGSPGSAMDSTTRDGLLSGVTFEGEATIGSGFAGGFEVAGTITNNATLRFLRDASNQAANALDQRFFVTDGATATIAGSGSLAFDGAETGLEGGGRDTSSIVNGPNHTILGEGTVRDVTLLNEGVVRVDALRFDLVSATIDGGRIVAADTGTLVSNDGLLRDVTIEGTLLLGVGVSHITDIGGTITNNGEIRLPSDRSNSLGNAVDQQLRVPAGSATLGGTGTLTLDGFETGVQGSGVAASELVHGPAHTISGEGTFQDVTVTNLGTIEVPAGSLTVLDATINNAGGRIDIADGAELSLSGIATIAGGTIAGTGGATIIGNDIAAVLDGATLEGELVLGGGRPSTIALAGTLTNNAAVRFLRDVSNGAASRIDNRLFVGAATTAVIGGPGTLTLDGFETGFEGDNPSDAVLVNAAGHTITGDGSIEDITLENNGTLRPTGLVRTVNANLTGAGVATIAPGAELEFNGGLLRQGTITREDATAIFDFNGERLEFDAFNGDLAHDVGTLSPHAGGTGDATIAGTLTQTAASVTEFEIGGLGSGQFDRLSVTGAAAIDGTLSVAFVDGFQPEIGDSWIVLESDADVTGQYLGLPDGAAVGAPVGGVQLFVSYAVRDGRTVALLARDQRCSLADLAEPLGIIDIFDIVAFFSVFAEGGALTDLNLDGVSDIFDIILYFEQFAVGC